MRLDDPALVADEYADDARLRKRASAYTGEHTGVDARVPLVAAVVEARPRRVLEVGCGLDERWLAKPVKRCGGSRYLGQLRLLCLLHLGRTSL